MPSAACWRLRQASAESSAGGGIADRLNDLRTAGAESLSELESNARYAWIDGLLAQAIDQPSRLEGRRSDRADRILAHRLFGVAIFVLVNVLVFEAIYTWSGPLMDGIDALFASPAATAPRRSSLPVPCKASSSMALIAGVGGVLIFLPQIAILFFFIALLEDSGYMARAALLMDRPAHPRGAVWHGLHAPAVQLCLRRPRALWPLAPLRIGAIALPPSWSRR